jgi:Dolichyl-phosphate-mannose-protein mannosyltransferase
VVTARQRVFRGLVGPKVALGVIIGIFIALSTVVAFKTPAWESNDEPDHVQNIETLVSGHWYGMHVGHVHTVLYDGQRFNVDASSSSGTEAHQAPLYYLLLAGWQKLVDVPARTPNPGPVDIAYPADGLFKHHSAADHRFLLWLRLPNVVLGALVIWFTYLAARIITTDPWTPVVAAAIIGFLPRFVFLSAFVTNDNLVNFLGAVLTFVALRCVVAPSRWRIALAGAIVGLLVATKLSALPVVVVVPIVLATRQREWFTRAQFVVIGYGASLVTCGWYLVQNTVRYGSPLALGASQRYLAKIGGTGTPYGVAYKVSDPVRYMVVDVPTRFLDIFWYGSGWNQIARWPWPMGLVFWIGLALALIGLVYVHPPRGVFAVLGVLTVAAFLSVWIVSFQTATYDPRLALVGGSALACLAALGLQRWKLGVRFLLPLLGLGGALFAIQTNVLAVHWS